MEVENETTRRVSVDLPNDLVREIKERGLKYRVVMRRGMDAIKGSSTINDDVIDLRKELDDFANSNSKNLARIHDLILRVRETEKRLDKLEPKKKKNDKVAV